MRKYLKICLLLLLCGCDDGDQDFSSIHPDSRMIVESCNQENLSITEIKNNLPGNWQLIDFACSFCVVTQEPEVNIQFSERMGVMQYSDQTVNDSIFDFTWSIAVDTLYNGPKLVTKPENYILNSLAVFCKNYTYFDHRPGDGVFFLFAKE